MRDSDMMPMVAQAAYSIALVISSILVLLDLRLRTSPLNCQKPLLVDEASMDYVNSACSARGKAFSFNATALEQQGEWSTEDEEFLRFGYQPNLNSVPPLLLILAIIAAVPLFLAYIQSRKLKQDMAHMRKLIKIESSESEILSSYAKLFRHPRMPKRFTCNLLVALLAFSNNIVIACIFVTYFDFNIACLFPSKLLCPEFSTYCYSPTNDLLRSLFQPCNFLASFAFGSYAFNLIFHLSLWIVPPFRACLVAAGWADERINTKIYNAARKLGPNQCFFIRDLEESLNQEQVLSILQMVTGTKEKNGQV